MRWRRDRGEGTDGPDGADDDGRGWSVGEDSWESPSGPPSDPPPGAPTDVGPDAGPGVTSGATSRPTSGPRGGTTSGGGVELDPADLAAATRRAVTRALAEDLGDRGDVTSQACVPPLASGVAHAVARGLGTIAGTAAFVETFAQVDPQVDVELRVTDGDRVDAGDVVAEVRGRLRSVLTAERTALNLLGRLSGVATTTHAFVEAVEGTGCTIRDTRKTTPGLRLLEKAAVAAGGGVNHRIGLSDALLVKDNHIAAAGGVDAATSAALGRAGGRPVQVEVTSVDELERALSAGATDVLADNLDPDGLRGLVARASGRATVEASGGITLDTVRSYAETGVDRIAVGALTHSARTLDIALDVVETDTGTDPDDDAPDEPVVGGAPHAASPEPELFGDEADARRPQA